jgi:hypothetical protein
MGNINIWNNVWPRVKLKIVFFLLQPPPQHPSRGPEGCCPPPIPCKPSGPEYTEDIWVMDTICELVGDILKHPCSSILFGSPFLPPVQKILQS